MIIHADRVQKGEKARIETFVVGHDIQKGEKLQWVVEGGKYKASFLLPDVDDSSASQGLLISEVRAEKKPSPSSLLVATPVLTPPPPIKKHTLHLFGAHVKIL